MRIVWREFWIFCGALLPIAVIFGLMRFPWYVGFIAGGLIGGFWPRKFIQLKAAQLEAAKGEK